MSESPERTVVRPDSLPWNPVVTGQGGVAERMLATRGPRDPYTTSLLRLDSGANLPEPPDGWSHELLILDGSLQLGDAELPTGTFARRGSTPTGPTLSSTGCLLFQKVTPLTNPTEAPDLTVDTNRQPWSPGHGNLRVKSLFSAGQQGTALVHWPEGERFVPHQHFGGEEILVLSGTFLDEHGSYPTGTWIQSAHLSRHHPYVEEETVIYVKTGHLLPTG